MNSIVLIGRLGDDPEVRTTDKTTIAKMRLAVDRPPRNGEKQGPDWVPCTCFAKTAEIVSQYTHKGDQIGVEGRLQVRSYEHEGQKRKATEVVVNRVTLLGGKRERGEAKDDMPGEEDIPW